MLTLQTVTRASFFTRLDFRPKLVLMAVLTLTAFLWESVALNGALALGVILAALAAGVSGRYIRRVLGLMAPFYVILLLTQGFWAGDMLRARTGQTVLTPLLTLPAHWWLIGGGQMSLEGVLYALNLIAKTLTMTLVIPLGVFTTDANAMIVGLVKAHIPYKFAFIFSSTLRFFPLLFAEAQTILEAQRLRGLAFEDLGLLKRVSLYAKIAVPLILNALVKAQTLEIVLLSRAFSGSPERTYLHESRLAAWDYALLVSSALFFIAVLVAYFGWGLGRMGGPLANF